jgi:steroid delta-isomerase-like uncharacterized protein
MMVSTTRTIAELKELVSRFHDEVWSEGNLDLIDEVIAEDYVEHNPAVPYEVRGREAYKQNVETFRTAFPDLSFTEEDVIAEGDRVVTRLTARGTHDGEFMDAEPTGNTFEVTGITIWRIEDGKVVEAWVQADIMGMMQQIGLAPEPQADGE